MISYAIFIVLVVHAHRQILRDPKTTGSEPWWKIIWLLYLSSICIMVSHSPKCCWHTFTRCFRSDAPTVLPSLRKVMVCSLATFKLNYHSHDDSRWIFNPTWESVFFCLIALYHNMLIPCRSLLLSPRHITAFTRDLYLYSILACQIHRIQHGRT